MAELREGACARAKRKRLRVLPDFLGIHQQCQPFADSSHDLSQAFVFHTSSKRRLTSTIFVHPGRWRRPTGATRAMATCRAMTNRPGRPCELVYPARSRYLRRWTAHAWTAPFISGTTVGSSRHHSNGTRRGRRLGRAHAHRLGSVRSGKRHGGRRPRTCHRSCN